jgi:hypothetical protein
MSGHPEREGGGGGNLAAWKPNSRFHVSKCTDSPGDLLIKFQFPSFRVSGAPPWVRRGTPKTRFHVSKCADSRILLCKFQIPSFRVSKAPLWVRGGTPISKFLVSWWADSRILLRKFQIPRFRVCRFQDIPGQIPDSVFPSFRGPLLGPSPKEHLRSTTPKFQIPSFRVSEVPSSVQGRGTPKSPQIPDSEFPSFRGPLLALGSQQEHEQEGLANSQIPSFRV